MFSIRCIRNHRCRREKVSFNNTNLLADSATRFGWCRESIQKLWMLDYKSCIHWYGCSIVSACNGNKKWRLFLYKIFTIFTSIATQRIFFGKRRRRESVHWRSSQWIDSCVTRHRVSIHFWLHKRRVHDQRKKCCHYRCL